MSLDNVLVGSSENLGKVLIVDYSNLLYRCVFVAFNEDPTDIEFKYWKHLMMFSIKGYIEQFKPDHLIFSVDTKKSLWRHKILSSYKGQRKSQRDASPVDFEKFFPIAHKFRDDLKSLLPNAYFVSSDGIEADDFTAVLVKNIHDRCSEIVNVSTDKDFYQLFKYPNYKQWNPIKKVFCEVLDPSAFLQAKILMGDKSDNIPPVCERMGAATAQKYVNHLDRLFDKHPEAIEKYELNTKLISFDQIPQEVEDKVMEVFKGYESGEYANRKMFNFLMENGLAKFSENLQEFNEEMKTIKPMVL